MDFKSFTLELRPGILCVVAGYVARERETSSLPGTHFLPSSGISSTLCYVNGWLLFCRGEGQMGDRGERP